MNDGKLLTRLLGGMLVHFRLHLELRAALRGCRGLVRVEGCGWRCAARRNHKQRGIDT